MPTYRAGTVTLTNGSKTVTGSGTQWANAINGVFPGMMFIGPDGKINIIATVASNTSLTLEDNYTGSTASGQAYKIITTYEGDISQFSARFTALLARFEGNSDVLYTWLTSTATTMTWTKADGTTETVATLSAITATVPVARGGTGATTAAQARENLGLGSIATLNSPLNLSSGGSQLETGAFGNARNRVTGDTTSDEWKSYLSSVHNNVAGSDNISDDGGWRSFISVRHRSGQTDGINFGFVITDTAMTATNSNSIKIYKQVPQGWLYPVTVLHSGNTTRDSNGFLKAASPIVKLFNDGSIETNNDAIGATAERIGTGEYKISGCLGFNSDPAWGGIDGGIEIPLDINKQPLVWAQTEVESDGSIIIRTYHRTHPDAPEFAQNNIEGVENGQPIDIPAGRWVDVRVQMTGSVELDTLSSELFESELE